MTTSLILLATFTLGVLINNIINPETLNADLSARLIILTSWTSGLLYLLKKRSNKPLEKQKISPEIVRIKSLSLRAALISLLIYSTLLRYFQSSWHASIFTFDYVLLLPLFLWVAPHYISWTERRTSFQEDGYYRFGQLLSGQRRWDWSEQRDWLLMWTVKIIFIPLMYSWLILSVTELLHISWRINPGLIITAIFIFGLSIDLLVATGGYLLASRLLGNEVLSTDRHWLGWLSCLICYPPLVFILHEVKKQTDNIDWSQWLLPSEPLYWFWAAAITSTWLVYWISTLHFGLRFSNLSWRGLVDTGPYRYTKHPAYISKNIYWWLHTVPFVGVATQLDLLRNLLGLSFVSLVYYLRAKTEERHLMAFPEYRAYSQHIDQYGLLARLKRPWQRASV